MGVNHIEPLISHCTSSFEASSVLLDRTSLPWPFAAMARICVESAARLIYVTDPDVDADQRLMRIVALIAWSDHEANRMLAANPEPTSISSRAQEVMVEEMRYLDVCVSAAGYRVDRSSRTPVVRDPTGRRPAEPAEKNMVDTLSKMPPGFGDRYYSRSSAFVDRQPSGAQGECAGDQIQHVGADSARLRHIRHLPRHDLDVCSSMNASCNYSGTPNGLVLRQSRKAVRVIQQERAHLERHLSAPSAMDSDDPQMSSVADYVSGVWDIRR